MVSKFSAQRSLDGTVGWSVRPLITAHAATMAQVTGKRRRTPRTRQTGCLRVRRLAAHHRSRVDDMSVIGLTDLFVDQRAQPTVAQLNSFDNTAIYDIGY